MRREYFGQADRNDLSSRGRPELKACRSFFFSTWFVPFLSPLHFVYLTISSGEKNSSQTESISLKRGQRVFSTVTRS